ncbi:tetratricopeptide repeat domain protein [Vibrio parahaemolyticus AQ3810]|nr:tetratricopeptide repeat domain protein [Vibrio parahaemolyticus AQ3810]
MSQFYKLRALSLVFWFVFLTTKVYAQSPEPKDKFLQSLEGIESQIYALPQSSLAQIESLEEDSLLQNQPKDLLIRYWLAKSTVLELLGRDKESLAVVDKGLSLTPEQSQEHLLFKLIQIRAMMGNRDIDTALSSLDALLETSREKGDKKLESEVLLLKGRYYDEQGDYKKSYAALMSSMEAAESSGAQGLVERAALELGDVLVKIQGYDRSEVVLQQAVSLQLSLTLVTPVKIVVYVLLVCRLLQKLLLISYLTLVLTAFLLSTYTQSKSKASSMFL